jgi:hypothetical protein
VAQREYVRQTATSALGDDVAARDLARLESGEVPATVRALVVHMDQVPGGAPSDRSDEPAIRDVAVMLARLRGLDPTGGLTGPRSPGSRLIGHCRTSSVLATALYRNLGLAARPRCGFSVYYADGRDFFGDHWVVEVWDEPAATWRLVDTELDDETRAVHGITFDPIDVPRDQLVLAGRAWLDCRAGSARPETFGPYPERTGWQQLADQLLRDAACLCGQEVGPFDSWSPQPLAEDDREVLDALARACTEPGVTSVDLAPLRTAHPWLVPPEPLGQ